MSGFIVGHVSLDLASETRHQRRGTRPRILLRERRFNVATEAIGRTTDIARAELLDVTDRTIRRARQGIIGEDFIAKLLVHLREHQTELDEFGIEVSFDYFFEVTDGSR